MGLNNNLLQVTESFTINLADRVRQMQAQGIQIMGLQTGDPDFNTPKPIMDASYQAMLQGKTHYANSRGIPELRQAISAYTQQRTGITIDSTTEMLVTHGGTHAYHCTIAAIMNPNEEILIPAASWQTHANMVRVLNGKPILVPALPENGFFPTIETLEKYVTPQTVAVVINTPNNPTGSVASRAYLQELLAFAERHDIYVISDEVYDHLLYDGTVFTSCLQLEGAKERVIVINSFSKTFAMTGWRIGYVLAPKAVISNALKESQHTITNVAEFIQWGAYTALTDPAVAQSVQLMVDAYADRRRLVIEAHQALNPRRVKIIRPSGAFYFFLDVRDAQLPSKVMAERLLNEARVACVPGLSYGESGEGFLRMTIAADVETVVEGFKAIVNWVEAL